MEQSASQISDLFRRGAEVGGTDQGLEIPTRSDPRGRDCHAVNKQRPAYLRRETRLMEHVECPLLGSGESVDQDLSLTAGEEPPQEDGGRLLVSCTQHNQSVWAP